ncbi:MAG: phosphoribosylamine--glycine ligase [Caldilineaceae bacterium]|nr:phosphoribosylamine--glycine ligase [Caldilineaceae bacterium]
MQLLLIGNGGREHALAWKLAQSPQVTRILVAPGNGGTETPAKCENRPVNVEDLDGLVALAQAEQIDLVVVGPEVPLVAGVVDRFQAAGIAAFGPTAAAARIEGSKAFSKEFMLRHNIPTGEAAIFSDFDEAMRYLRGVDDAPVIKADGLAAGKGVILPSGKLDAANVIQSILLDGKFGVAGQTVLLEERLEGPELSVLAFCDGKHAIMMPAAQDHKRAWDNDGGPNTGGMGAFAPAPLATPALMAQVEETILRPTLAGMAAEGMPFTGVLFMGLMITATGPKVIEYNCRFGDPEAQVILPLLESDLVEILLACVEGRLDQVTLGWREGAAVTVVMASAGYPVEYEVGIEITNIEAAEQLGCLVFHAGTKRLNGRLLTAGGRVLTVTSVGKNLGDARAQAYGGVHKIHFNNAQYRKDIGRKAVMG